MKNVLDYWASINRYKTRQLYFRLKYRLEKTKIINDSYPLLNTPYILNDCIDLRSIKFISITDGKRTQIEETLANLDKNLIVLFGKEYRIDNLFDYEDIKPNTRHKLRAYELSYFQFCHDLSFAVIDNTIEENKLAANTQLIISVLSQSIYLTNKHPFWYPYSVSSRVINLSLYFSVIINSPEISAEDKTSLYNHLLLSMEFLRNHLEFDCDGNHLLKNYIALFIASGVVGKKENSKDYFSKLLSLAQNQLLKSGLHYEKSIDYHSLVLHDLFIAELIADYIGFDTKNTITPQIKNMVSCLESLLQEEEKPLFHDTFQSSYFTNHDILKMINNYHMPVGEKKTILIDDLDCYFLYRKHGFQIIIDKSQVSPKHCPAHSHDSCLHYELWYNGVKFITDSGNGTYSESKERNYFRSSHAHNLTVPDENTSQSILMKSFRFGRTATLLKFEKKSLENKDSIIGSVSGYFQGLKTHILERSFEIYKDNIIIEDTINCDSSISYIHFSPNVSIEYIGKENSYILSRLENKIKIILGGDIINTELINTLYSDAFYSYETKKTLKITFNNKLHYQIFKYE